GMLDAHVELDQVVQRARAAAPWKEALVVVERERAEHDAEATLRVPGALADHRVLPEPGEAFAAAEPRVLLGRDREPVADELLDAHRHAEMAPQHHLEALGAAHLAAEHPRVRELREVGCAVAVAKRRRAQAAERGEAPAEMVLGGAVEAHRGLRLRPSAVEELEHAVVEHVEEAHERRIAGVALAVARPVGEMDRQGAVGAEQAEHALHQARRTRRGGRLERGKRGGRERERGLLREAHRLVQRTPRLADACALRMRRLDHAHRLEEIELPGRALELPERYRTGRWPNRVGHRITSPRPITSSAVSVNELSDTCLARNSSSTEPSRNAPPPSKARSSHERRTSIPRPNVTGPRAAMRRVIGAMRTERMPSRWRRTTDSLSRA